MGPSAKLSVGKTPPTMSFAVDFFSGVWLRVLALEIMDKFERIITRARLKPQIGGLWRSARFNDHRVWAETLGGTGFQEEITALRLGDEAFLVRTEGSMMTGTIAHGHSRRCLARSASAGYNKIVAAAFLVFIVLAQRDVAKATPTLFPGLTMTPLGAVAACTQIGTFNNVTQLDAIIFVSGVALPSASSFAIFTSSSCTAASEVYETGQVGAGAFIVLNIPVSGAPGTALYYTLASIGSSGGFRILYN